MLAGPNDVPPDFMQTFDLEEVDDHQNASLEEVFDYTPSPEAHPMTTDATTYDDPQAVSAALAEPFPATALFSDENGMTYVQYQQVIRRLMKATGNRFSVDVLDQRITDHGQTRNGNDRYLVLATVKLTIPVLQSSRTHVGMQIVTKGGEDLFKGAVSDGIKKAAQAFGVGIELAGDDRELAPKMADTYAPERAQETRQQYQQQSQQPRPAPQAPRQQAPQRQNGGGYSGPQRGIGEGGPASDAQKNAIHKMAGKARTDVDKLLYDETNGQEVWDNLSKGTASHLIDMLKTILDG